MVAPGERKRIDTAFEQVRKEWRTRRKMVMVYPCGNIIISSKHAVCMEFVDIFHTVSEHSADKPEELKVSRDSNRSFTLAKFIFLGSAWYRGRFHPIREHCITVAISYYLNRYIGSGIKYVWIVQNDNYICTFEDCI